MHRSTMIVLDRHAAPLPPETALRSPAPRHWRNWRRSGAALSALLHVSVMAALTLSLPVFGRPAPAKDAIPVEIVPRTPEKKPDEAKREEPKKLEPPKPAEKPKASPGPDAKRLADAPKPAPPPSVPAAKPAPEPAAPQSEAARPAPAPPRPPPAFAPAPPPPAPEASLPPVPPPVPEAGRPKGPPGGLKVDADEVPPPGERNALGYWVLEPLTADLRSRCGIARITGVLELRERIAEGHFRGLIRTRIAWARCPAEGAVHAVELRIKDGEVEMIGAGGSIDRGAMRGNRMMLEDAYGRSVWKKR